MNSFKDFDSQKGIQRTYYNEDCGLLQNFIVPTLSIAKYYYRSVAYFSSSVIELILPAISQLYRKKAKIQLIVSPELTKEDIEAIDLGYKDRQTTLEQKFDINIATELAQMSDENLRVLEKLIKDNILDIRVACKKGFGNYHDKIGIMVDEFGDSVAFDGSANSSYNAYYYNYEHITVYKSWDASVDYLTDLKQEFESLWKSEKETVEVKEYKDAVLEKVIKIREEKEIITKATKKEEFKLRDYQEEAIQKWVSNKYTGFYVMATGTGKTLTAIYSAKELLKVSNALIVICAPYKHLIKQWSFDIEKVFPKAKVILISSENPDWPRQLSEAIIRQRYEEDFQVIAISTMKSFMTDTFASIVSSSKQEKLLIVDEAHRLTTRPEYLKDTYKYKLGLSATPGNGKNQDFVNELMNFFGGEVYSLPLEKALKLGKLTPYKYVPIYVHMTQEEEDKYNSFANKIAGCFKKGVLVKQDDFLKYLRARQRVISMASEKAEKIREILSQVKEKDHLIVYCGDGRMSDNGDDIRHISFVKGILDEFGYRPNQFTAQENMAKRMQIIDSFNKGDNKALAAIRCLDEGVDIPSIKSALILASNDDYREFVQRRGRILRLYEDKKFATIYDVIVLPSIESSNIAKIELRRFYEYARLVHDDKERTELLKDLDLYLSEYGLTYDDIEFTGAEEEMEVEDE